MAWFEEVCPVMRVFVDEIGGAWGDIATAIGDLSQTELAAANLRMAVAAMRIRDLLDGISAYPPGDEAKLYMIRVVNDSEDLSKKLAEAATWIEVDSYTDQITAGIDQLSEMTARMDALGFGRGKYC